MFYTILETGGDVIPVKAGVGIGHNTSVTNNASHSSNQVMVSIIHYVTSSAKHTYPTMLSLANIKFFDLCVYSVILSFKFTAIISVKFNYFSHAILAPSRLINLFKMLHVIIA